MGVRIYGNASWYSLCDGSNGACGDCDNWAYHLAWPELTTTGCDFDCDDINPPAACGDIVYIYDYCTEQGYWGKIKDCLPDTANPSNCDLATYCHGNREYQSAFRRAIADLTQGMWYKIHGSFWIGLWTKCVLPPYMAVGQALYPHILGRFTGLSKLQSGVTGE